MRLKYSSFSCCQHFKDDPLYLLVASYLALWILTVISVPHIESVRSCCHIEAQNATINFSHLVFLHFLVFSLKVRMYKNINKIYNFNA